MGGGVGVVVGVAVGVGVGAAVDVGVAEGAAVSGSVGAASPSHAATSTKTPSDQINKRNGFIVSSDMLTTEWLQQLAPRVGLDLLSLGHCSSHWLSWSRR